MSITLRDKRSGGSRTARPKEFYLEVGREYVRRFGENQLTQAAFNPSTAKRAGRPDLVERYYSGREDGTSWPSLNAIKRHWPKWNDFRKELGLKPNSTGPGPNGRRKTGEAEPILDVRERRVIVESGARAEWLQRQLDRQTRRADRLAEQLDAERANLAEQLERSSAEFRETEKILELRKRLADELHRRKDVQRELHNAIRRESRARASSERADRRGNAASLREVDRLTQKLVEAQNEIRELRVTSTSVPKPKTRTVTRTVKIQDEKLINPVEKLEARVTDLRVSLRAMTESRDEALSRLATIRIEAVESAQESIQVRKAEYALAEASRRVDELSEILLGAHRMPTEAEMQKLRTDGPAGDSVLKAAVLRVARSEGKGARKEALWSLIGSARNWIDRL